MTTEVRLNEVTIQGTDFHHETVTDYTTNKSLHKVHFSFKVKSGEEYHDITTLLYKQNFDVEVPKESLKFKGTITNYSTSVTNLYEANNVGNFYVELTERT